MKKIIEDFNNAAFIVSDLLNTKITVDSNALNELLEYAESGGALTLKTNNAYLFYNLFASRFIFDETKTFVTKCEARQTLDNNESVTIDFVI